MFCGLKAEGSWGAAYAAGRHCVFAMHVHLVFVTKYRRRVFTGAGLDDLREVFARVCAEFDAELVEMDGEDDHVRLLVNYPPKVPVSVLVNGLKGLQAAGCGRCARR
jgi:putative transposase